MKKISSKLSFAIGIIACAVIISVVVSEVIMRRQNNAVPASENSVITAADLAPYIGGIVQLSCDNGYAGSGSLWNDPQLGYIVITNNHVIEGSQANCDLTIQHGDATASSYGAHYQADLGTLMRWNDKTDVAAMKVIIDPNVASNSAKIGTPISTLDYQISALPKCQPEMAVGSPVMVIGYPAYGDLMLAYPITESFRIVTNGIISALDSLPSRFTINMGSTTIGGLPYPNYFVSAKVDSGNSGGIALSKDQNGLCVLGLPTWVSTGNYDNEGLVQNINNVLFSQQP